MTLVNERQKELTLLCDGGPRYPSVDTVILEMTLKNMGNVLAKIVKKSIYNEMKLAGSVMKKHASLP